MTDQDDFFFDEEEKQAEAKKPSATSSNAAAKSGAVAGASFATQTITVTVAGLVAVCALLVGVVLGLVVAPDSSGTVPISSSPASTGQTAPELTPEQLNNTDKLPEGHPQINGGTGSGSTGATATPQGGSGTSSGK